MIVTRAIVTGGAGTLGVAAARILLGRGAEVLLIDWDAAALAIAEEDLADQRVSCRAMDVSSMPDWNKLVDGLKERGWHTDFLINNACLPSARLPLTKIDPDRWNSMLSVGLTGAFFGIRAIVPGMVARNKGMVLNIASMAGLSPVPEHGDYAATKAGLVSLSETLRVELVGTGVDVAVACPGAIGRPVGSEAGDRGVSLANGRMDAVKGMKHVIDAALQKAFFIVTHAEGRRPVARRAEELLAAFGHAAV